MKQYEVLMLDSTLAEAGDDPGSTEVLMRNSVLELDMPALAFSKASSAEIYSSMLHLGTMAAKNGRF
jgi:hypothetical protein